MNNILKLHQQLSVDERRQQVASLLARSKTQTEIAQILNVSQPTIHRDIEALREQSVQFVYDLCKADIAYEYKKKLNSLDEVKREAWDLYNKEGTTVKEKSNILKTIVMLEDTG